MSISVTQLFINRFKHTKVNNLNFSWVVICALLGTKNANSLIITYYCILSRLLGGGQDSWI